MELPEVEIYTDGPLGHGRRVVVNGVEVPHVVNVVTNIGVDTITSVTITLNAGIITIINETA